MNKEVFENQWAQIKTFIKDKWTRLTDEDIRQINGRLDQLIDKIQQRYGYSRDVAEDEVRNWSFDRSKAYTTEKPYVQGVRDDEAWKNKKTDSNSILKWVLGLGIPLALLAGYLSYDHSRMAEDTNSRTTTRDTVITETPEDRTISQSIRNVLLENNTLTPDARNNLRIHTVNGVVTIRGSVATNQERDLIQRIVENIQGIRRVDNQIQVR